jgi:crotonobetainyl-CoA:carnitine CoA-transferase CaiB-like acyl-CoA transferase
MELKKEMPLEGIKIIEYGVFHAGPGGGAILGDLGAEVIKVESAAGDPLRYWTDIAGFDFSIAENESIMHEVSNRNKKSICLDIKKEQGRNIFNQLIKSADIFLTNLRKSTKTRLSLDYPSISGINPKIIHANVSGYGPEGPMDDVGAFDPMGQALSGLMFVTGASQPALMHIGILDQTTSIALSHAIITALLVRERKGIGQEVHVSLYGTALWMQYANLMINSFLSIDPCITQNRFHHSPLRNSYRCKDGIWLMGTHHPEEKYWGPFCRAVGKAELLKDSRYTDDTGKPLKSAEMIEILDNLFATRSSKDWMDVFKDVKLMFCPIQRVGDIKTDPQALVNNYMVPFNHPKVGDVKIPGYPFHFSASQAGTRCSAPELGEHTQEILLELGLQEEDIGKLRDEGVIP